MKSGLVFSVTERGINCEVRYTKHFVERFESGGPKENRDPVSDYITEGVVAEKIHVALPEIVRISNTEKTAQGIIRSVTTKLNMPFAIQRTGPKSINITMKTMMVHTGFFPAEKTDHVIEVNPRIRIQFLNRGVSSTLKDMVLHDLYGKYKKVKPDAVVQLGNEYITYYTEKAKHSILIDEPHYNHEMWEIDVP